MSSELVLGIIGTLTGIIGTVTGLTNLILNRIREQPRLRVGDSMISLQKNGGNLKVGVSFNVDNIGDRGTTIIRTNVIVGPNVEVIEGLRNVSAHSSIIIPEKSDSSIGFSFPSDIKFPDGTRKQYFKEKEKLEIIVFHTNGKVEKSYDLPPSSEWEKQALFKGGPIVLILG